MHIILATLLICPLHLFAGHIEYLDIALTGPLRSNHTVVPNTASFPSLSAELAELIETSPDTYHFIDDNITPLLGSARFSTHINPLDKKAFTLNTAEFSQQTNPCTLTFRTNFQRYLDVTIDGICHDSSSQLTFFHEARRTKINQIQLITTPTFNLLFTFKSPLHPKN